MQAFYPTVPKKKFPAISLPGILRVCVCYCAMNFNGYTKTIKVDNYRSLSAVRLHGADPVHFLTIFKKTSCRPLNKQLRITVT